MLRTIRPSTLPTAVLLPTLGVSLACAPSEDVTSGVEVSIPDAVAEWQASDPVATYDTETIYDYIDGHAEVYLAYGMKRSLARRYTGPAGEADIVLDLFELASPEDAFGVFTHDLDGVPVGIGAGSLLRYGWLSFWQGPWFVSVSSEMESDRANQAVLELGRSIAELLPAEGASPAVIEALPEAGLDPQSVRFLRHPQILNTHLWVGDENIFGLTPEAAAALASYSRDEVGAHLLLVDYPDAGAATVARRTFAATFLGGAAGQEAVEHEDEKWYAAGRSGERLAAVLASDSRQLAESLVIEALEDSQ